MALKVKQNLNKLTQFFTAKVLTSLLVVTAITSLAATSYFYYRIGQIDAFNRAISIGRTPQTDQLSFEARFSTAYWLAQNERYKEAALLFNKALNNATPKQKAAIQYNIGNIFFRRGLAIAGTNYTVKDEAEYLLMQAKTAYMASIRLDNTNWGARHNLDRLMTMLPETPTPGVGESDSPGLIMGNIPVGLP
ncbi:MAG: hypothetical protein PHD12_04485 [Methylotenera sp.]|nr:hypothetical protein [Methylotenera sp.]